MDASHRRLHVRRAPAGETGSAYGDTGEVSTGTGEVSTDTGKVPVDSFLECLDSGSEQAEYLPEYFSTEGESVN